MSALDLLLVALGGAVGAPLRFVAAHHLDRALPWGTLLVNVLGSTLLGAFAALALGGSAYALLATGFCGGLTTWSSFAVQTHRIGGVRGTAYAVGTLVLSLLGCVVAFAVLAR
ncbi:fluoride efflux transporter FluC [Nocardioides sp. AX2bis]|uniref:fluoride efflux transporter FluC n=1 Tax=Nocardioides sp. AX2bis TaxID=2653157 RepID=UPI0012EFA812|nr:CrcB family protein [Nocardioides sp. AX2bis]VXC45043.1 Putative fluoride ion transporter CrcB 2 [Nocardioides sp. AX2bis]